MDYNYVIFGDSADHIRVMYNDVIQQNNVLFLDSFMSKKNSILYFFFKVHYSSKVNKLIRLPFKRIWFKKHFKNPFKNENRMVFVFLHQWYMIIKNGYIEYLRKKYPNCICVLYLQDIKQAEKFNIAEEKNRFDKVLVFERNFAREHGIEYYPLVYSEVLKDETVKAKTCDLVFIGRAKDRLPLIQSICERLTREKVKFDFYISDVPPSSESYNSAIHFIKQMNNYENIRLIKKSKCILDIVPLNTNCNTLRVSEAIAYGVKILTNNVHIVNEPFYNPEYISIYSSADDIDVDFLKRQFTPVDYKYKEQISPIQLLRYISNHVNSKGNI